MKEKRKGERRKGRRKERKKGRRKEKIQVWRNAGMGAQSRKVSLLSLFHFRVK